MSEWPVDKKCGCVFLNHSLECTRKMIQENTRKWGEGLRGQIEILTKALDESRARAAVQRHALEQIVNRCHQTVEGDRTIAGQALAPGAGSEMLEELDGIKRENASLIIELERLRIENQKQLDEGFRFLKERDELRAELTEVRKELHHEKVDTAIGQSRQWEAHSKKMDELIDRVALANPLVEIARTEIHGYADCGSPTCEQWECRGVRALKAYDDEKVQRRKGNI